MIEDEETMNEIVRYLNKVAKKITGQEKTSFCFILAHSAYKEEDLTINTLANIDEATSIPILKEFIARLEEHVEKQGTPNIETQH